MADCLVLNRNFYAIHIADWQKVVSLLYQGHAEAVDQDYNTYSFDQWIEKSKTMTESPSGFVSTPNLKIAIPEVIRLTRYDRLPSSEVKFTYENLCSHFGHTCSYCNKKFATKDLNRDHVIPRSRGGSTNWDNIVLSCVPCNLKKADRTPEEAGMPLRVKPQRPRWKGPLQAILKSSKIKLRPAWMRFVDPTYVESAYVQ